MLGLICYDSCQTLPTTSEPATSPALSTIPSSTPTVTSWKFHVTTPEGWEYDVIASNDLTFQYGKDTSLSPPGMARLTLAGSGALHLQFVPTQIDKTAPAIVIDQLHITFPDGFASGQHCGPSGEPMCLPVLAAVNAGDEDTASVDMVVKVRTNSAYYFEVRPLATVCVFSLFPDGSVRPLEEFDSSPCTFSGETVVSNTSL